jgi:hypothetical protein
MLWPQFSILLGKSSLGSTQHNKRFWILPYDLLNNKLKRLVGRPGCGRNALLLKVMEAQDGGAVKKFPKRTKEEEGGGGGGRGGGGGGGGEEERNLHSFRNLMIWKHQEPNLCFNHGVDDCKSMIPVHNCSYKYVFHQGSTCALI